MNETFNPGTMVHYHGRDWVVQPSSDPDLYRLKPLGGTDQEITGVYKKLLLPGVEQLRQSTFPLPATEDLGSFASSRLLYNAARLAFRNGAGPFRSMGQLAFRPRGYQLVPLIMALRLETVRLLIADDVGVGKTIEALLIVREMLDRGDIHRFAIVCLPHLCDQWQQELQEKFGLEAAVIRSGSVKKLEKQLAPGENLFQHFPYQVISIDYIKQGGKRDHFLHWAPEMIVVDEAHTCASPLGNANRQQRHSLIKEIANKPQQHLLLLSATPHSGKSEEFQSILGLLQPHFADTDLTQASKKQKDEVARHFVQRRRKDIEQWLDENTPFPNRVPDDATYTLTAEYLAFFQALLRFARKLAVERKQEDNAHQHRFRYYTAIGLLRGAMSSPATGATMLRNRLEKQPTDEATANDLPVSAISDHTILDHDFSQSEDLAPTALAEQVAFSDYERKQLRKLAQQADQLHGLAHDAKAARAHQMLVERLPNDNAIVFCRYIPTANYLGELLRESLAKAFGNDLVVAIITSELSDEERKAKVLEVQDDPRSHKLIVATDCMSEGINLQKAFSAVIHYDLPWNPNRLEQREGRVDRFGQPKKEVHTLMLYGKDNPMDGTVLKVLLRKAQEIRKAIGISVPFPDDSRSIMDAVLNAVLLKPQPQADQTIQGQLHFGQDDAVQQLEMQVEASFERIKEREQQITSVFAQHEIQPEELLPYLYETDAVLGNESTVAQFVAEALPLLGCTLQTTSSGHRLNTTHLKGDLRTLLPQGTQVKLAFQSPPPEGQHYVGRNHPFVDRLCQKLLEAALVRDPEIFLARGAVIRTDQVQTRTTLYLLRVRNVIASRQHQHDLVAEEMLLWGFTGPMGDHQPETHAFHLLDELRPTQQVPEQEKEQELQNALADYHRLRPEMEALARLRAAHMVEGHKRFHQLLDRNQFREVEPVLPPDVLGVYVILPE